jgi:VWFA-related protein
MIVAITAVTFLSVAGQKPDAQLPQAPIFTSETSLVVVPALVRTRNGDLVYTLKADDFVLTDDGVPQKLTLEPEAGGQPLALVVVIEIGGAGARELDQLGPLVPMFAALAGDVPRKIAVVGFDSQPALVHSFSSRMEDAVDAIAKLKPRCAGEEREDPCNAAGSVREDSQGDNGAAILDSLGFAVDLLRNQPPGYRRAILLVSETLDRGSHIPLENAVRAISDTNTTIYSLGFSTAKSEAVHYAYHELPTRPGQLLGSNMYPNPPHGCMGKDPNPDPDATHHRAAQAYDCLAQLAPPLALAKMVAIAAVDALNRNVPEAVARLTGGEYFRLTNARSLERSLATITNHLPNRYVLSFHPLSPHAGLHVLALRVPVYADLVVTARTSYWANSAMTAPDLPAGAH